MMRHIAIAGAALIAIMLPLPAGKGPVFADATAGKWGEGLLHLHWGEEVSAASVDPDTFYYRIKKLAEQEEQSLESELAVERHTAAMYYDHADQIEPFSDRDGVTLEFVMEELDVDRSVVMPPEYQRLCGEENAHTSKCVELRDLIEHLSERDVWLRKVGRELQIIAAGYENGIFGYPSHLTTLTGRMASITRMWRASSDPYVQPILEERTRGVNYPDEKADEIKAKFRELVDELHTLVRRRRGKEDTKDIVAAVHRYRHGYMYVREREGLCADGAVIAPGDLMALDQRYCTVEKKMDELYDIIFNSITVDPGPERGETILLPSFVEWENNLMVWARVGRSPAEEPAEGWERPQQAKYEGDIGIKWFIPYEPVFPTLFGKTYDDCMDATNDVRGCFTTNGETVIRGGMYPGRKGTEGRIVPEPKKHEGICSHPFMSKGYLCRDIDDSACKVIEKDWKDAQRPQGGNSNEDQNQDGANTIYLTRCQPERFKDDTERHISGPDICERGGWRGYVQENDVQMADTYEMQRDMRPAACSKCVVDLYCGQECGRSAAAPGFTDLRDKNGVVEICINPDALETPLALDYVILHEMIHAQQFCKLSTLEGIERIETAEACCALEREAHVASCKQMAIDGILERAGITIDECASAKANESCMRFMQVNGQNVSIDDLDNDGIEDEQEEEKDIAIDNICTNDGIDFRKVEKKITEALKELGPGLKLHTVCKEAVESPTEEVRTIKNTLPLACEPGCKSSYENTIGNNLCYVGQCIEQTYEMHRLIPGYMTLVDGGIAFPWDASTPGNPNLGEVELPPALIPPMIPTYSPEHLMNQLDMALCQLNGLPAKSPPVVCSFDPRRRIDIPLFSSYLGQAQSLSRQYAELDVTALGIEGAASAIGARLTTDLFTRYLETAIRAYADVIDIAQITLSSVGRLTIPQNACPI